MRELNGIVTFTKSDELYTNKLGVNRVIRINNQVVFRQLNGETIKDIRDKVEDKTQTHINKYIESMEFEEIKKDKKINHIAKKLYSNKKIKKLVKIFGNLVLTYATFTLLPGTAFALEQTVVVASELEEVKTFISFIINLIRVIASVICSLIAANAGLKILTEENADGIREAKKAANKILWALFLIFVGTSIANLITGRLLG